MSHNARVTTTDESRLERRHALSPARRRQPLFFFGGAGEETITLRVSWVGGKSPKIPPAEKRRRCSYGSLVKIERIVCVLGLSLGFRGVWAIVLVEKLGLGPP